MGCRYRLAEICTAEVVHAGARFLWPRRKANSMHTIFNYVIVGASGTGQVFLVNTIQE